MSWQAWLFGAVALVCLEVLSGDFVLVMLAVGAFVGALLAATGVATVPTVLAALATALLCLIFLRPPVLRALYTKTELKTGAAAIAGQQALVLETVRRDTPGRVKIGGDEWSALPFDFETTYEPGTWLEVVEVRGATAYIRGNP